MITYTYGVEMKAIYSNMYLEIPLGKIFGLPKWKKASIRLDIGTDLIWKEFEVDYLKVEKWLK
jgi:hypothetical protein